MKPHPYQIPERNRIRVIISTDAKNEVDDQFAIAYALMSPSIEVVGFVASHFRMACFAEDSPHYTTDPAQAELTMQQSYEEIERVLSKMELSGTCPVLHGATCWLEDEHTPRDSEGARFIIEQAHTPGLPLYIVNIGAATDMASAYLMDPSIAKTIAGAVWLGGGLYPEGGPEFNLVNDQAAANVLMDSGLALYQLPGSATVTIKMPLSELYCRVRPYGEIGAYLYEQVRAYIARDITPCKESRVVWDLGGIAVLLEPHLMQFTVRNAPRFGADMRYEETERKHEIRVYDRIEPRFVLEDFYCKLMMHFG